jgi:hypothetical protein
MGGVVFLGGSYLLLGFLWLVLRDSLSPQANKAAATVFGPFDWLSKAGEKTVAAAEGVTLKRVAAVVLLTPVLVVVAVMIVRVSEEGLRNLFGIFEGRLCRVPMLSFLGRSTLTYKLTYGWAFAMLIVAGSFIAWEKIFDQLLAGGFPLTWRGWLLPHGPEPKHYADWAWRLLGTVAVTADAALFFVGSIYSADWLFNVIPPIFSGLVLLASYLSILLTLSLVSSLSKR